MNWERDHLPDQTMMDVLAANAKEQRKINTIGAIHVAFPKASRQQLVVLLQQQGWNNFDIVEILEGIDDDPAYP